MNKKPIMIKRKWDPNLRNNCKMTLYNLLV